MRLISQNGMIDIPYEYICIELDDIYFTISAHSINDVCPDYCYPLGTYSSLEKAKKVMKQMQHNYYVRSVIFEFPKDEEV